MTKQKLFTTEEQRQEIEQTLNILWEAYDRALALGDTKSQIEASDLMREALDILDKLDENEIRIDTEKLLH
jgi:hypothetical protein